MSQPTAPEIPDSLADTYEELLAKVIFIQVLEKAPNQGEYLSNMSRSASTYRRAGLAKFPGRFDANAFLSLDGIVKAAIDIKIQELLGIPPRPDPTEGMAYLFPGPDGFAYPDDEWEGEEVL